MIQYLMQKNCTMNYANKQNNFKIQNNKKWIDLYLISF